MIVRDLLRSVARICSVIGQDDNINDDPEENDLLDSLNIMLADWSSKKGILFYTPINSFNIIKSKAFYGIGEGKDFDIKVPFYISNMYVNYGSTSSQIMSSISEDEYFRKSYKNVESIPNSFFFNKGYPFGNIYFYPVPNRNMSVVISSYHSFDEYHSALDEIDLAPFYIRAIKFNLALDYASEYDLELGMTIKSRATKSFQYLKDISRKVHERTYIDSALLQSPYRDFYNGN